jgi:nucleotide-binding universal stress UspA family protein
MVPVIKKILFATDLSENSRYAFYYAASLATAHRAAIVMLHIMETSLSSMEQQLANLFGKEKWELMQEGHKTTARDIIIAKRKDYDIVRRALASFSDFTGENNGNDAFETNEIIVKEGNIVEEILNAAADTHCDMIVMGSHKALLGRTSVGKVAKSILQQTKIPVLIVPPPDSGSK